MINFATIALVLILGILLWYRRWNTSTSVKTINQIPGPRKLPLTGNLFSVPRNSTGFFKRIQKEWVEMYGKIFRVWRMMSPSIVISSPEFIEKIIAGQKHIEKGDAYKFAVPWMGDGLLLSKGDKWKKDRRMLTPSFHFQILEGFFDDFNRNAAILNRVIEDKLLKIDNGELDIFPLLSASTLDIICEAAMGNPVNAQLSGSDYTEAINRMLPMLRERHSSLLGIAPDWLYLKTPHGRDFQKCLDTVRNFAAKALRERKISRKERQMNDEVDASDNELGMKKRKAFLDIMLDVAEETGELSEENILDQVNTFMFAGHDTTSVALNWALYCLATHPDEQDKVYEELMEVFDGSVDRPCTSQDLTRLKYLDCCVKEALRRHPSAPLIRRKVSENVQLGKYTVPAGTTVSILIYALHHNEDHFPDPESFKPERFLPEQSAGRHPYAFIPFSAGSRNCIGQKYAIYEEKVILASLLRKFRFSIDPARLPIKETSDGVLKPSGGMHLIIEKRL